MGAAESVDAPETEVNTGPIGYLTRVETFSAAHRLHSPLLDKFENMNYFGKCNHIHGHGHNYKVEVTVRGPISKNCGMVMSMAKLKDYMHDVIINTLDHKNLDQDVDYFRSHVSTTENLAVYIWEGLKGVMENPKLLYEVKVCETDKNIVTYRGE